MGRSFAKCRSRQEHPLFSDQKKNGSERKGERRDSERMKREEKKWQTKRARKGREKKKNGSLFLSLRS